MRNFTLYAARCFFAILFLLISACAAVPQKAEEKKITEEKITPEKKMPTPEEQQTKALEIFNNILTLTEEAADRQAILPQMEALYKGIIDNYPEAQIVEESYWRLINLYAEFVPPKIENAERLYQDFLKRYHGSSMKIAIEKTLGEFYQTNKMWERLLRFFTPQVKTFVKTGKLDDPYHLFMYSEAKFNLNDLAEAEKGYKIVIEFFPKTPEAETSNNRLKEIQNLRK